MENNRNDTEAQFDTAVLLVVFNRLDTTKRVFEAIRQMRPSRLYVAGDGPRPSRPGEDRTVAAVRQYLLDHVDWNCRLQTRFPDENRGCRQAVSGAISWFFEHEEQGIIFEDDCLPHRDFFRYCENLLARYKDDRRVWHIGGCNFQEGHLRGSGSYYFSAYCHVWGWATWADRWKDFDLSLRNMPDGDFLDRVFPDPQEAAYWKSNYEQVKDEKLNSWAYPWVLTVWLNRGLAISPNANLISNIGFGQEATHTGSANPYESNLPLRELGPMVHPEAVVRDLAADQLTYRRLYQPRPFLTRVINKGLRLLHMRTLSL